MQTDMFGYDLSISSTEAAESWNNLIRAFLAHSAIAPDHLGRTLELEPDWAMGHAVRGMFCMMLGRREMTDAARDCLAAANRALAAGGATWRERAFVQALSDWLAGHPSKSITQIEAILRDYPRDALAMKCSHAIRFILGDIEGMLKSVESVLPAYDAKHPALGYAMGCHSFALEESGDYTRAELVGRMAVEHTADDAWGLHAVAHVYDMTGNSKAGLEWLSGRESAWAHCNNFRFHVWWHKALMHLDQGQVDEAIALYDAEVRKDHTDDYRDISNGTSLLMRLELEGVDVGNRWEELADLCANRTEDGSLIFADLHYMLALMGGRRENAARSLVSRIRSDATDGLAEKDTRMARPGLAAAVGLEAFGEGNYKAAFTNLKQARIDMQDAGGSHAQRDVFERITIDAGIRSGDWDSAETILNERLAKRAGNMDRFAAARYELIKGQRGDSTPVVSLSKSKPTGSLIGKAQFGT